jgi:hypothetical protein
MNLYLLQGYPRSPYPAEVYTNDIRLEAGGYLLRHLPHD